MASCVARAEHRPRVAGSSAAISGVSAWSSKSRCGSGRRCAPREAVQTAHGAASAQRQDQNRHLLPSTLAWRDPPRRRGNRPEAVARRRTRSPSPNDRCGVRQQDRAHIAGAVAERGQRGQHILAGRPDSRASISHTPDSSVTSLQLTASPGEVHVVGYLNKCRCRSHAGESRSGSRARRSRARRVREPEGWDGRERGEAGRGGSTRVGASRAREAGRGRVATRDGSRRTRWLN